jgi:hypothetical protein
MPPKRAAAESKQGLVITLVIFILLTLGLGVATYYGFAEQEALTKAAKEAKDNEKKFKDERDFYRVQSNLLRVSVGLPRQPDFTDNELAQGRDQIVSGTMGKGLASQKEVQDLITGTLEKKVGWDAVGKKPKTSYEDLLGKAKQDIENLRNSNTDLERRTAQAEKKQKDAEVMLADARKDFEAKLIEVDQNAKKALETDRKTIEELRTEITRLGTVQEEIAKKAEKEKKSIQDLVDSGKKQIKKMNELVAARNDELAQYKLKGTGAAVTMRTDWQITYMDPRGTMPYINLGTADKVKPQVTFSIHGLGLDGKPNPEPKGTLEVVNVLGEHLAQARITSVKDPHRDPILKGDTLFNPLWNPNLKKHIAIAGMVDLSGGSRDAALGMDDFLRSLERQNVIVDAYMDPRENFKIKGPGISVTTDYLVMAQNLDTFADGRERNVEMARAVEKGVAEMKDQAAKNGVAVLGLRKYLEMIGYRMPPHLAEQSDVSPLYKPRPDHLPRKPVERQPQEKADGAPGK